MTEEQLHLAASGYANRRKEAYKQAMARGDVNHMNEDELSCIWVAHYEGYREGHWVANGDLMFSTDPAKLKEKNT